MANTFKYFRFDIDYYRIEYDSDGAPVGGAVLKSDGSWIPFNRAWHLIEVNNTPISEEEAFRLAGIKRDNVPVENSSPNSS